MTAATAPTATGGAHIIVLGNEKGGSGKSTTAVHIAVALAHAGFRTAMLDLDARQRTIARYLENRVAYLGKRGLALPTPDIAVIADGDGDTDVLAQRIAQAQGLDFLIIDTPGRDSALARAALAAANTIVTPINDSFVDFDLIGQVDAETFKVRRLSFFAELIWEARIKRSRVTLEQQRPEMDWIVVRNRTGHVEARNQARLHNALSEMSKRVGFRVTRGLSERVIYRELFPSGLTLLDKGQLGELGTSHLVARQELRALVKALSLPEFSREGEMELAS